MTRQKLIALTSAALLAASSTIAFTGQNNPDCMPGSKNQTTAKRKDGKTVC
jgi:hypothetical protein